MSATRRSAPPGPRPLISQRTRAGAGAGAAWPVGTLDRAGRSWGTLRPLASASNPDAADSSAAWRLRSLRESLPLAPGSGSAR